MRAGWEKRGNRYFAYARVSRYDKERQKVITQNKYLGGDIQTAITNLRRFGQEMGLAQDAVAEAVSQLKRQGQELGVKPDACTYDNKTLCGGLNRGLTKSSRQSWTRQRPRNARNCNRS